ncbi:oxygen-independent coproporphyrinogen III oxidase [Reyranella sp.]|uniref:oxygen-independent coproporphyrinogen III oxidase n=1 Tax=Reyranella sp. TaxID=1929291 RepID=UPI003BABE276
MDATTIAAYDRSVPRYTSYPTAAQFHGAVGAVEHKAWLADLARDCPTVYLHVPFCKRLCWYCACHTAAMNRSESLAAYARALMKEIDLVAEAVPGMMVGQIQWGGGTPSQLGATNLVAVAKRLAARFDRRSGSETSMEVDPRFCDEEFVATMREIGVDRVSFGVQDFDLDVQKAINRLQSIEDTASAMSRIRGAGIGRINIDLVYGLPKQTPETLARTLDAALDLAPDRFAVFAYAHVPWMKARQRLIETESLPGAEARAAMANLVAERLVEGGYKRIGLDHYARPNDALSTAADRGRLRRSFQGYVAVDQPSVVGLGASAISSLPRGYTQNIADPGRYQSMIEAGCFASARGLELTDADRLRGEIIEKLMCSFSVDLDDVCRRHGASARSFVSEVAALPQLVSDGLVQRDGEKLQVTERGRPLVRFVCAAFDAHLAHADGRHSRGI